MYEDKTDDQLKTDRRDLLRDSAAIMDTAKAENRSMTAEEVTKADGLMDQAEAIGEELESRAVTARVAARQSSIDESLSEVEERATPPIETNRVAGASGVSFPLTRFPEAFRSAANPRQAAADAGMWFAATFPGFKFRDTAVRYCRNRGIEYRAVTLSGEGTDLVPVEMERAIIDLREQYGTFRQNARVYNMSRDKMDLPKRTGSITATWANENATLSDQTPTYGKVTLDTEKLGATTTVSTEMMEDNAVDLGDDIARDFAMQFALAEDTAGWTADDSTSPPGIAGVNHIFENDTPGLTTTASGNTFAAVTLDDLNAVIGSLPQYAHPGAKWYVSGMFKALVFGESAMHGGLTFSDTAEGIRNRFMGYDVVVVPGSLFPNSAAANTTGDVMAVFGDLRMGAALGQRRGFNLRISEHVAFLEDAITIRGTERIDIQNHGVGTGGSLAALVSA